MSKEELEKYQEHLIKEISAFLKNPKTSQEPKRYPVECPMCKRPRWRFLTSTNKFKDFLEKRNICVTCERDEKLNDLGIC